MTKGERFSICFLLLVAALSSCSSSSGPFRLEGKFKNMNQAEFYIFDQQKGWKDTIHVRSGRMAYERSLTDTATLVLMFPNYSVIPIFARPGITVEMQGDASHLRETEVKGSDENKEMTAFRLRANNQMPPEVIASARDYILEQPASPVSFYLLQRYFIQGPTPDYAEAYRLCDTIAKTGGNGAAVRLRKELARLKNGAMGSKLPAFSAKATDGKAVTNKQLQSDVNVVQLWATWNSESRSLLTQLHKLQKEHRDRISIVSVSLDASPSESRSFLERDSISHPVVCDGLMWQSPLVIKLGMATLPANIITNKQGKIVARNINTSKELKEKIEELLETTTK